jgi:predicted small lipoprotein YifL
LTSLSGLRLVRIGVIGALVGAFGLAGCGRKGGLDPPPASVVDQNAVVQPGQGGPETGPDGKAKVPASAQRRRTPIDWLLD